MLLVRRSNDRCGRHARGCGYGSCPIGCRSRARADCRGSARVVGRTGVGARDSGSLWLPAWSSRGKAVQVEARVAIAPADASRGGHRTPLKGPTDCVLPLSPGPLGLAAGTFALSCAPRPVPLGRPVLWLWTKRNAGPVTDRRSSASLTPSYGILADRKGSVRNFAVLSVSRFTIPSR